ncbi:hypothetical protein ABIE18_004383 [Arthrobacter sp. 2762]
MGDSVKARLVFVTLAVVAAVVAAVLVWQPWARPASSAEGSVALGPGWSTTVEFPEGSGLRAQVTAKTPTEEQLMAQPSTATLVGLSAYEMDGGSFPDAGASVRMTLETPVAQDHVVVAAHWNENAKTWEPIPTELSEDRTTATAKVSHFSQYGFFDYLFNTLGQVTGNAATSGVSCEQPVPTWADPQFFDDINSPILWCGGKDANNSDILVAKLKMNRDTAAKVTVAIDPAWAWSDLWQAGPTDLATMAAAAELPKNPFDKRQYLVQPFGEMHFGFNRTALEELYYGNSGKPLIQVETGWFYTAAATIWSQIGGLAGGDSPITAIASTMALMECGHELLTIGASGTAVDAYRKALACLSTDQAKDAVHRGVRTLLADRYPHLSAGWITVYAQKILSKFGLIGLGIGTAGISLKIFSAIGDSALNDDVRQLRFTPSVSAIKARAEKAKSSRSVPGMPEVLKGKWCSHSIPGDCFSANEYLAKYPGFRFHSSSPARGVPQATDYVLCLELDLGDSCTTAMTIYLRYFPPGVAWDCVKIEVVGEGWPGCNPDYTSEHDASEPRVVKLLNHQHGTNYSDAIPMYSLG